MTIDEQIRDLEAKKLKLEQEKKELDTSLKKEKFESIVGKYYKEYGVGGTRNNNCIWINYLHPQSLARIDSDVATAAYHGLSIGVSISKPGLCIDDWNKKKLHNFLGNNLLRIDSRVLTNRGISVEPYFQIREVGENYIATQYHRYSECSQQEFLEVQNKAQHYGLLFYEDFSFFLQKDYYAHHVPVTSPDIRRLEHLDKLIGEGLDIRTLLDLSKRVAKFNLFTPENQLEQLVQYSISGEKGLHLGITGGDGGTDYEPYVTHYYVSEVNINWLDILYPIRLNVKGSLHDLDEKLCSITEVYDISNWKVTCNTSGYDARFESAALNKSTLDLVNKTIKQHLK
jgi:hypothetical protein